MEFVIENYLVIILVGLFFVFALIGYLIDIVRKTDFLKKETTTNDIKPVEISEINIENKNEDTKDLQMVDNNDADELLKNYDNTKSE